jgi:hypothetical protein
VNRKTRLFAIAVGIFAVLFLLRFAYEMALDDGSGGGYYPPPRFEEFQSADAPAPSASRKNYASAKIVIEQAQAAQTVEQKYERVSTIDAETDEWDADLSELRAAIAATEALVQRENASGLPGSRYLSLSLGVVPGAFDGAVEKFKAVGDLVSINTVKTDRTADFRALEAKRLSLEKTRDGLAALRSAGAALSDRIALESRILEIEGQIQELGVSLGDFSELNSFCTVDITLREIEKDDPVARAAAALFSALSWTVPVYLGLGFALLFVAAGLHFGLKVYDRFKG